MKVILQSSLFLSMSLLLLGASQNAWAAGVSSDVDANVDANVDADVEHNVSVTISPLHLLFPVVELTGEVRVADKLGLAAIAGAGFTASGGTAFGVYELGAQAAFYPVGTFIHGMQIGVEGMWTYVNADSNSGVAERARGISVGPFLGYKIATNVGFTFQLQAGVQALLMRADAGGNSAAAFGWAPLLNINLGWSF